MDSGPPPATSFAPPGAQPLYGGAGGAPDPSPPAASSGLRRWLGIAAVAAGLAVAALLVLGLRGGSSGDSPLSPIAQAAERTSAVTGARFSGTGQATGSGLGMTMSFEGVYNAEDERSSMRMNVATASAPQVAALMNPLIAVQDGLTTYMTSPLFSTQLPDGKSWMKVDMSEFTGDASGGGPPVEGMDARAVLDQLALVSDDARVLGRESIRGVATTHYAATINPELQAQQLRDAGNDLAAEVIEGQSGAASVGVWVDRKGLVRRVAMTLPFELVAGSGAAMSMTIDFFDFGISPEIKIPSDEEAFDATELGKQALEGALGGA